MNPMQIISQLKSNPAMLLSQRFNIPQGMNDPNQIIQHLLNTGQVSQDAVNRAMQMKNNPMIQQLLSNK
jgi:hypothetical protein